MIRISISAAVVALLVLGCATNKQELLPHGEHTMQDIWDRETSGGNPRTPSSRSLLDARQALKRPLTDVDAGTVSRLEIPYTRTAANEIYRQFQRLPNPDLVMYVFAHLAGTDPVPVPGYTTVFPFYQRVQYALPGERTEDY